MKRLALLGLVALCLVGCSSSGSGATGSTDPAIVPPPPPPGSSSRLEELAVAGTPVEVLERALTVRACALLGLGDVSAAREVLERAAGAVLMDGSDAGALLDALDAGDPSDVIASRAPCPTADDVGG